jgi:hypothetical protein
MSNIKIETYNEEIFSSCRDYDVYHMKIKYITYSDNTFKYSTVIRPQEINKDFENAFEAYNYIFDYIKKYLVSNEFNPSMNDIRNWSTQCYFTEIKEINKCMINDAKFYHSLVFVKSELDEEEKLWIPIYIIDECTFRKYKKCYKLKIIK